MRTRITAYLFFLFLLLTFSGFTQNNTVSSEQMEEYTQYSEQLISYLESTLNFIGDGNELQSEKDLIINNTYQKIFANDKVQIEDDLDENREITLNKDVQAYLKDIDFFFRNVEFSFNVEDIHQLVNDSGEIVFKVTTNRFLKGVTIKNDTIENNQLRYIEINLNPYHKNLKIASIYTTKIKEKDAIKNWWNSMDEGWRNFFGRSVIVFDTLPLSNVISFTDSTIVAENWQTKLIYDTIGYNNVTYDSIIISDSIPVILTDTLNKLAYDTIKANTSIIVQILTSFKSIEEVDISKNLTINNLDPVAELANLRKLYISNSLISDLSPARNLNKLEVLICSGSAVANLDPLIYNTSLREIDISNTAVADAATVVNFKNLDKLNISYTPITDITFISNLKQVSGLKMEGTLVNNFKPLGGMSNLSDLDLSNSKLFNLNTVDTIKSLQLLNIDSTTISNLTPLTKFPNLKILQANNTNISNLTPLLKCENLKMIYCDNSKVTFDEANIFMEKNKNCLVIFNSAELIKWWESLSTTWKQIFESNYNIEKPITKEKLQNLINQKNISLAYNKQIQSIKPLNMMHRLEEIDMSGTGVFDLVPLTSMNNLENLNVKKTMVKDLSPLETLNNLRYLNIENTTVDDISMLTGATGLEIIYADNTCLDQNRVQALREVVPECLIIFQSEKLRMWWNNLEQPWRSEFSKQFDLPISPSNEQLQNLVNQETLEIINNNEIINLNALHIFKNLDHLVINNTSVSDLSQLNSITTLRSLDISNNPVSDIHYLAGLVNLEELIMENTPVDDIEAISALNNLRILNISGTRVKNLKYIQSLNNLQKLFINNTRIKNIKVLDKLNEMKELQCYNTSVKPSKIEAYKSRFPHVDIVFY